MIIIDVINYIAINSNKWLYLTVNCASKSSYFIIVGLITKQIFNGNCVCNILNMKF